jgi:hypothetical protein
MESKEEILKGEIKTLRVVSQDSLGSYPLLIEVLLQ